MIQFGVSKSESVLSSPVLAGHHASEKKSLFPAVSQGMGDLVAANAFGAVGAVTEGMQLSRTASSVQ